jgi:hypothetical protein
MILYSPWAWPQPVIFYRLRACKFKTVICVAVSFLFYHMPDLWGSVAGPDGVSNLPSVVKAIGIGNVKISNIGFTCFMNMNSDPHAALPSHALSPTRYKDTVDSSAVWPRASQAAHTLNGLTESAVDYVVNDMVSLIGWMGCS